MKHLRSWSALMAVTVGGTLACVGDSPNPDSPAPDAGTNGGDGGSPLDSGAPSDSGGTTDADAAPVRCDPKSAFATIVAVPGVSTTDVTVTFARLTADERTIYFAQNPKGDITARLRYGTRMSTTDPFGSFADVPGLLAPPDAGTTYIDSAPAISADDRVLYWVSTRYSPTSPRIWTASRTATGSGSPFTNPAVVAGIPTTPVAYVPFTIGTGQVLYFNRGTPSKIYRAVASGAAFGSAAEVDLGGEAEYAAVSPDDLVIYFSSDRGGGANSLDVYVATRKSANDAFDPPVKVADLSSSDPTDAVTWVSADYCRVYLFHAAEGKLLVATRSP